MPVCYCLVVSLSSSQDVFSNQCSVFHLVEELRTEAREVYVPFETLSWWSFSPEQLNIEYEARLELYSGSNLVTYSPPAPLKSESQRHRLRLVGFPIPPVDGDLAIRFAYRRAEEDWVTSEAQWLITIEGATAEVKENKAAID